MKFIFINQEHLSCFVEIIVNHLSFLQESWINNFKIVCANASSIYEEASLISNGLERDEKENEHSTEVKST